MALIDKVKNTLESLFQKMNRGMFTPDEYNDAVKFVQNKIIREALDFLNHIRNQEKIGRVVKIDYDKQRFYREVTRRLLSEGDLAYNGTTERFEIPEDYSFMQAIFFEEKEIEEVSYNERFILNNPLVASDEEFPVCFMGSDDIEVIPDSITSDVKMYYYRDAKDPKWTYQTISGKAVFDADAEDYQDFELPEAIFDEIVRECASWFGVQVKQPDIAKVSEKSETSSEQLKRLD